MAEGQECPTGLLLDFSEPAEINLSPELACVSSIGLSSVSVCSKQMDDFESDKNQFGSPVAEESVNVSSESDCDFIENETMSELSACSTQSSSISGDEALPIIWSPKVSKKKSRRDRLSIGQRVEVFKEATSIAMHLENLSRGTPPPTPFRYLFASPLLERKQQNDEASNSKIDLESRFDLESCSKGLENKRPESETGNPISFHPPLFAKPQARVQPILKTKIKDKDFTSETISKALRINKNKAMAAKASSSKQSGPMKAKKGSPLKRCTTQQRDISKGSLNATNSKTPLLNYKPVSGIRTPSNANSTSEKRIATVTRSSSFGSESLRTRRQSSVLSASFSGVKPPIHNKTPTGKYCQSQANKTNLKPVPRRSVGPGYSTPVRPSASEGCRSFAEPDTIKRSVIPMPRFSPHPASDTTLKPTRTPLQRSSSVTGDIPKKNSLQLKRCDSTGSVLKKNVLPFPRPLATCRSSVPK